MNNIQATAASLVIGVLASVAGAGDLTLPSVFSDHMVLQRETTVKVWGWAEPATAVDVVFGGVKHSQQSGRDGAWAVWFDAMPASSEPRTMTVRTKHDTIRIEDVLVGEVWLCSGQSNMVWTINGSQMSEQFTADADEPRIRLFKIPNTAKHEPQKDCPGSWQAASSETVGNFSAVAYHFGRNLIGELDVPIGLISTNWGGSTVEAWVSRPELAKIEAAEPFIEVYDKVHAALQTDIAEYTALDANESGWETMPLPVLVENAGHDVDGMMWFRRTIDVPRHWVGNDLSLTLGPIDDNDVTFFNGRRVGATNGHRKMRNYTIPANQVKAGRAVIAIRVEDTGGAGGFNGKDGDMELRVIGKRDPAMPLNGPWKFKVMLDVPTGPKQHRPANLYNGMIHPIRHYEVRGAIWYQGESNAIRPRGEEYFTIFPAMIADWRDKFDQPEMPFYFVQLPNFTSNEPNTIWRYPVVRQAQLETMRSVPHTGMAVTLDLGEAKDIHPRNKHDVGRRLAAWALVDTYGVEGMVKSGPIFKDASFRGNEVRVSFDLYGSKLATLDGGEAVTGFEIAGSDGEFVPAGAAIDGDHVVVRAGGARQIESVRYAWKNNADDANLVNSRGWPASPFRNSSSR
jgi:sialate O-acetylesterase